MNKTIFYILLTNILLPILPLFAQEKIEDFDQEYVNWYNLDPKKDKVLGTSANRAYEELLKDKKSKKTIVVAVLDTGVDIDHEDFKGNIWINEDEIPDNGIDDDNNGYIDDIHGWNFLGNDKDEYIMHENYEFARIYRKFHSKYKDVKDASFVAQKDKKEYQMYEAAAQEYQKQLSEKEEERKNLRRFEKQFKEAKQLITPALEGKELNLENVKNLKADSEMLKAVKDYFTQVFEAGFAESTLKEMKKNTNQYLDKHINLEFTPRQDIVGDDPFKWNDKVYGNANVRGQKSSHGTSVAGVIGAVRNNGIGIDGIAENVKIMALRMVPKGDEYDKDIALAIRYAVDNGADIVNMSFGKGYSPQKHFVDEAVKYAADKNVLLIHACGNESQNVDVSPRYPSDNYTDGSDIPHWMNVGANGKSMDKTLTPYFSNYGQEDVDLFAPGDNVISLKPKNRYEMGSGTSLASPVVSGVAALVWSYYPELTALELKEVLMKSSHKVKRPKVLLPAGYGEKRPKTKFKKLSISGGVVNAYNALLLAEKMSK